MTESSSRRIPRVKFAVFSVLPMLIVVGCAELVFRLAGLDEARVTTKPLPGEGELLRPDRDLFWSVAPNAFMQMSGAWVRTNSLGLRGAEVGAREPGALRILSLGESTTFGVGVANDETYTARLERMLEEQLPETPVTTFNAGTPAWSSFQSLQYLKQRGLALDPHIVLFYHEGNDFLPTSLRDSSNNEVGISKTDAELHRSRVHGAARLLRQYSAVYRALARLRADRQIERFSASAVADPFLQIGLTEAPVVDRLVTEPDAAGEASEIEEGALKRRVSPQERREILEELLALTEREGIVLVLMHPSYFTTQPHECGLTRFAAERGLPLFDAHPALHRPVDELGDLFLDSMHPTARGHRRIARQLARFLDANAIPPSHSREGSEGS